MDEDRNSCVGQEVLFHEIVETAPVPMIVSRFGGEVIYANRRAEEIFGVFPEELEGRNAARLYVSPEDRDAWIEEVQTMGFVYDREIRMKTLGGREFCALLSAAPLRRDDEDVLLIGVSDITRQKELEAELVRLAEIDGLTEILNRRSFMERSAMELKRAFRHRTPTSLLIIDIDHFKNVNDTYGHHVGDEVLRSLARRLADGLRREDLLGRIGGEEFAALLPQTDLEGALLAAERLRLAVESMVVPCDGWEIRITVSIGASLQEAERVQDLERLLKSADSALYAAKQNGRNRVETA